MPKAQLQTSTRVRLLRHTTTPPYRKPLRIFAVDVPLVHKTSFPLKSSLYRDAYEEIVQYTEALDIIPIHRQSFPLCRDSDLTVESASTISHESESTVASEDDFSSQTHSTPLGSIEVGLNDPLLQTSPRIRTTSPRTRIQSPRIRTQSPRTRIQSPLIRTQSPLIRTQSPHIRTLNLDETRHQKGRRTIPTASMCAPAPDGIKLPLQYERKIRNVDIIMFWFVSDGPEPIHEPLRPGIRFADLYLHLHGSSDVQIWIWNSSDVWETIEQGYVHPQLPDRRLWLISRDEPSWITRKTARTYKGRQLKEQ